MNTDTPECDDYMEHTTKISDMRWKTIDKCSTVAKYAVSYRSGMRGSIETKNLCQRHFTALRRRCESLEKRTGWKSNLQFMLIN